MNVKNREIEKIVKMEVVERGGKVVAIINGKESNRYDDICDITVVGRHYGYIARRGLKWVAVIDGREEKEYNDVWNLSFNADGTRYAYIARDGDKYVVVMNGQESGEYDFIWSVDVDNSSFRAIKEGKCIMVVDGLEFDPEGLL